MELFTVKLIINNCQPLPEQPVTAIAAKRIDPLQMFKCFPLVKKV